MRRIAPILLLAGLCAAALPATTARMPLDEVRPGMRGVGVTVFDGTRREEFGVEVLGVLRNVMGPRRDLVVARLSGGPLAETGVIQGMSGSPVYVDGRLVGAVSYSLGSFPREALAGITPIAEMAAADADRGAAARLGLRPPAFPAAAADLQAVLGAAFDRARPFARQPDHVRAFGLPEAAGARLGTLLRPIATPVVLGGFDPRVRALWAAAFEAGGFAAAVGAGQSAGAAAPRDGLQAGDPVGAALVRGDLTMAGTGTVTLVDGARVWAFGHPFYNLGPIRFPMTRASVTALLPSLALSSKIAAIGEVVGTLDQDRSTGIFGALGAAPGMLPVRVALHAPGRGLRREFAFEVVEDRLLTPLLAYTGVLSTVLSWNRERGAASYAVRATTRVRGHDDVAFDDVYSGDGAPFGAAGAIANPLTTLLNNRIAPLALEGIDVEISAAEQPRTATIERVWLDAPRVRPGAAVRLHVLVRGYGGAEQVETVRLDIPRHARGRLRLLVADAPRLSARERGEAHAAPEPATVAHVVRALNETRRNNRVYVRLLGARPGAVVRGAAMPALPPSVLAVLEGDRGGSGLRRLSEATLGEWEIRTDHAVSGSRTLAVDVEDG